MVKKKPSKTDQVITSWYSYMGGKYSGVLPAFYDKTKWGVLEEAERNFPALKAEIDQLLRSRGLLLERYFNPQLTNGRWEVVNFYFWGRVHEQNCAACPELKRFLEGIPGLLSATLSKLSPHTDIHPHIGDTNLIARCHLGIVIPATLPDCGLEVNNEQRSWQEGKWLIFCDAYEHSAWNHTDEARLVLIVDVVLPEFLAREKTIAANVRSLLKLQKLGIKLPWINQLPGPIKGIIRHIYKFT